MPRVTKVTKSQRDQGSCGKCGKKLPKGSGYVWWKFRYGGKRKRCTAAVCYPRPSDLTQSEILGQLYSIQEDMDLEGCDSPEAIREHAEEILSQVRELGEETTEKADNMEAGFGHETQGSEELRERGEAFEAWAEEIESAAGEVEDRPEEPVDPGEPGDEPDQPDLEEPDEDASEGDRERYDEAVEAYEAAHADWSDEVTEHETYESELDEYNAYDLDEARAGVQAAFDESPE